MRKKTWTACLASAVLTAGFVLASPVSAQALEIPDGVYVGEFNLGGLTKEEAQEKIDSYIEELKNQKITLDVDGSPVEATAGELGFMWKNPEAVEEAAAVYKGGNLIERYLALAEIEHENVKIPLETGLDEGKVSAFVEERCSALTVQPQDASIAREDGKFVVTPSVVGKVVDIEATRNALEAELAKGLEKPVTVKAAVAESLPSVSTEDLETIQDVLGTFSTDFSSSGNSRATNLRVGSGKINGRVLMPGETLSGYECMKPFTTANGYATAAAYENGQVVDSVGGGVCQIATTLYNAALRAEVEITQRQNHSMVVAYVKPSEDAAIAGTYKDIKITNNYSTPIYVEGYTSGRTLTFTIYGKETRPANRTFKFVSETLSVSSPGEPTLKVDPSLPPGKRVQVQSAHRGLKSRLWKYVYIDGVEQSREVLHTDTYNASKAIIRVGPEAPAAVPPEAQETPAETQAPQAVEGVNGGPGVPPVPAPTEPAPAPTEPAPADSAPPDGGPGA